MAAQWFTLQLADGSLITGVIHGSGGVVGEGLHNIERIHREIRRATEGHRLGIFEPKPGHARVYPHYSAVDAGESVDVDLRGARLTDSITDVFAEAP